MREVIEIAVVGRACEAFDPEARQRVEDLLETQESTARQGDQKSFRRYDELFHMALSSGTGCPMAWRAVEDIKAHMDRVCLLTLPGAEAMLPLVEQHRDIVEAMKMSGPSNEPGKDQHGN